jgi:mannose-6-phosphate isomerase-like protein (cupin superfamily)
MTKLLTSVGFLCVVIAVAVIANAMGSVTVVPAGSEKWAPMAGMPGLSVAVLYGNPKGSGVYAELLKTSALVSIPPHTHPNDEMVTVISGSAEVGLGPMVNWSKATTLGPGSFVGIPAGVVHYARFKAGTTIEISGLAPDTIKPVKMSSM